MNTLQCCPKCGAVLPEGSQLSLCGSCLLRLGVELDRERSDVTKTDLGAVTHRQATMVGVQFHHLGGYEFEGELARGGMGMVFRAWQRALQRHVALKLMLPDQVDSKERVRRFKLEAEATARLEHPNIVPIYEIGENRRPTFSLHETDPGRDPGSRTGEGPVRSAARL